MWHNYLTSSICLRYFRDKIISVSGTRGFLFFLAEYLNVKLNDPTSLCYFINKLSQRDKSGTVRLEIASTFQLRMQLLKQKYRNFWRISRCSKKSVSNHKCCLIKYNLFLFDIYLTLFIIVYNFWFEKYLFKPLLICRKL